MLSLGRVGVGMRRGVTEILPMDDMEPTALVGVCEGSSLVSRLDFVLSVPWLLRVGRKRPDLVRMEWNGRGAMRAVLFSISIDGEARHRGVIAVVEVVPVLWWDFEIFLSVDLNEKLGCLAGPVAAGAAKLCLLKIFILGLLGSQDVSLCLFAPDSLRRPLRDSDRNACDPSLRPNTDDFLMYGSWLESLDEVVLLSRQRNGLCALED